MFGRVLDETLGKICFWTFFLGFHLTFFVQHFLGLMGMPRRVWTYLDGMGFNNLNLISTIGAFLMGIGTIVFLINIVVTAAKPRNATNDPWEDGRTLEWSISSPAPEYNFAQTPLVRGYDAYWKEKMEGKGAMTPAEPLGSIHMPSPSILPFFMSVGLFIAGLGLMYADGHYSNSFVATIFNKHIFTGFGLLITFACMFLRSVYDDHGFHIEPDELHDKGVKA